MRFNGPIRVRIGATFERDKIEIKEAKTQAWQETSMSAITSAALQQGSPAPNVLEKTCTQCGESVFATNPESADIKLAVHMKEHGIAMAIEPTVLQESDLQELTEEDFYQKLHESNTPSTSEPIPSAAQEALLAKVVNFPGWCEIAGCDFVCDGKSASGAKVSLRFHAKKEHVDGN